MTATIYHLPPRILPAAAPAPGFTWSPEFAAQVDRSVAAALEASPPS